MRAIQSQVSSEVLDSKLLAELISAISAVRPDLLANGQPDLSRLKKALKATKQPARQAVFDPRTKVIQQLILVKKGLDVAETLSRIKPVSWAFPVGGKIQITGKRHSLRDLRLCCHDLRPLFLPKEPFHRKALSGLLGPFKKHGNRRALEVGLQMLNHVAPTESRAAPLLLSNIPVSKLTAEGYLEDELMPGYNHSPGYVATAYLYGQWAHGLRAVDLVAMSSCFGSDADFEALSTFAHDAGHGFLLALLGFAEEQLGREMPPLPDGINILVSVPRVSKKLRALTRTLEAVLARLSVGRKRVAHVKSF